MRTRAEAGRHLTGISNRPICFVTGAARGIGKALPDVVLESGQTSEAKLSGPLMASPIGSSHNSEVGSLAWDVRALAIGWHRLMMDSQIGMALILILQRVNKARVSSSHDASQDEEEEVLAVLHQASHRLAVYGSLAPGQPNHSVIQDIGGGWTDGFVRGKLAESGWGSGIGYPAITWDPDADPVSVKMFVSSELPDHWKRLDTFEGAEYARILVPVEDEGGGLITVANIYALRP